MKTIRLPVTKEETFYVANDGKKFTTAYEGMLHEYRVAVTDATVNFDFAFANNCKTMFTLVYHANLNIVLAEDLSIIINHLWDVEHTNMADNYEPGVILDTLEHSRGCPFEDGRRYSFVGKRCYTGEDHDDNFYMYIEDVSEDRKASVYINYPRAKDP
jgi:hypothetical protein